MESSGEGVGRGGAKRSSEWSGNMFRGIGMTTNVGDPFHGLHMIAGTLGTPLEVLASVTKEFKKRHKQKLEDNFIRV